MTKIAIIITPLSIKTCMALNLESIVLTIGKYYAFGLYHGTTVESDLQGNILIFSIIFHGQKMIFVFFLCNLNPFIIIIIHEIGRLRFKYCSYLF